MPPRRSIRFWQFGGAAFVAGSFFGAMAGPTAFPFVLGVTAIIISGGAFALALMIRAASLTGQTASQYVYEKSSKFFSAGVATIAAFAGYCLSGLLLRG
jgi:hypothetical protein